LPFLVFMVGCLGVLVVFLWLHSLVRSSLALLCISRFGSLAFLVVLFHFHWLVILGFDGCVFCICSPVYLVVWIPRKDSNVP
jgi:hypothetical protein